MIIFNSNDLRNIVNEDDKKEILRINYFKYIKQVTFYVTNKIKSRQDAEEIIQDVFINFYKNMNKVSSSKAVKGYLMLVAKNYVSDYYKKKKVELVEYFDDIYLEYEHVDDEWLFIIKEWLDIISKYEITILTKYILFDKTFLEIGRELNVSENSVKTTYYRALNKVRNYYKKNKLNK